MSAHNRDQPISDYDDLPSVTSPVPTTASSSGFSSGGRSSSIASLDEDFSFTSPTKKDNGYGIVSSRGVVQQNFKPAHDPMQFVKAGPVATLSGSSLISSSEEVTTKMRGDGRRLSAPVMMKSPQAKFDDEEWQNDLDNWKSKRRQISCSQLPRSTSEFELHEDGQTEEFGGSGRRKPKTFNQIIENRTSKKFFNLDLYKDREDDQQSSLDLVSVGPTDSSNSANNTELYHQDQEPLVFDNEPTSSERTTDCSSFNGHQSEESPQDSQEQMTFDKAIMSYVQYAQKTVKKPVSLPEPSPKLDVTEIKQMAACANASKVPCATGCGREVILTVNCKSTSINPRSQGNGRVIGKKIASFESKGRGYEGEVEEEIGDDAYKGTKPDRDSNFKAKLASFQKLSSSEGENAGQPQVKRKNDPDFLASMKPKISLVDINSFKSGLTKPRSPSPLPRPTVEVDLFEYNGNSQGPEEHDPDLANTDFERQLEDLGFRGESERISPSQRASQRLQDIESSGLSGLELSDIDSALDELRDNSRQPSPAINNNRMQILANESVSAFGHSYRSQKQTGTPGDNGQETHDDNDYLIRERQILEELEREERRSEQVLPATGRIMKTVLKEAKKPTMLGVEEQQWSGSDCSSAFTSDTNRSSQNYADYQQLNRPPLLQSAVRSAQSQSAFRAPVHSHHPLPSEKNDRYVQHWLVQEAELRRIAEQNQRRVSPVENGLRPHQPVENSHTVPPPHYNHMQSRVVPTSVNGGNYNAQLQNFNQQLVYNQPIYGLNIHQEPSYNDRVITEPIYGSRQAVYGTRLSAVQDNQTFSNAKTARPQVPSTYHYGSNSQDAIYGTFLHPDALKKLDPIYDARSNMAAPASKRTDGSMLSVSGRKKCSHCARELGRGAAMIIETLQLYYHVDCFCCCVCQTRLGNGSSGADVRVRNNRLHCQNCYSNDDGLKSSEV